MPLPRGSVQSTIGTSKWRWHPAHWDLRVTALAEAAGRNFQLPFDLWTKKLFHRRSRPCIVNIVFQSIENTFFLFPFCLPLKSIPWPNQTQSPLPAPCPLFILESYSLGPVSIFQSPHVFPQYQLPLPRHSPCHLKAVAKCALLTLTNIPISYSKHPAHYKHPSGLIYMSKG